MISGACGDYGEVAEWLNAAVLKCLQLTSISPRKYHLSTRSRQIDPYHILFGEKIREKNRFSHWRHFTPLRAI
jgi:hypothetical protein